MTQIVDTRTPYYAHIYLATPFWNATVIAIESSFHSVSRFM
jgi:hypothetical protein